MCRAASAWGFFFCCMPPNETLLGVCSGSRRPVTEQSKKRVRLHALNGNKPYVDAPETHYM